MTMSPISKFTGSHRFLSNFWPCRNLVYDFLFYPTVEHAYQAMKTLDSEKQFWVAMAPSARQAKRRGRTLTIRTDWDQVKQQVMLELLRLKFADEYLRDWLLRTDDRELIEGNSWGDIYWSVCGGKGENHLGKLLMQVRSEIVVAASKKL